MRFARLPESSANNSIVMRTYSTAANASSRISLNRTICFPLRRPDAAGFICMPKSGPRDGKNSKLFWYAVQRKALDFEYIRNGILASAAQYHFKNQIAAHLERSPLTARFLFAGRTEDL